MSVINDVTKQAVQVSLIDNEDSTYSVEVNPDAPGTYTTNLTYGGLKVPFNKKTVISTPTDTSKVQVEGLEQSECFRPFSFAVNFFSFRYNSSTYARVIQILNIWRLSVWQNFLTPIFDNNWH